jgi:hypothetical protein
MSSILQYHNTVIIITFYELASIIITMYSLQINCENGLISIIPFMLSLL